MRNIDEKNRIIETVDEKGNEIILYLYPSNYEINRLCDIEYRKSWTYAISNGVHPHRFLLEIFQKEKIWTEQYEKELTQLNADLAIQSILLDKFLKEGKKEEAKKNALDMYDKRNRAFVLSELKHEAFIHSAEGIAHEIRLEAYLAFATVYNEDRNKKFYKDYQDFTNRRNEQASIDISARYYSLILSENINIYVWIVAEVARATSI